jgi:iron complex outermembrane recepter protein
MRIAVMAAAICLATVGLSAAAESNAAIRKDTDIPAEGLGPALETLARTYEFQVLYRTEVVGELRTQGAAGTMTAPEALNRVLTGTGLSFKYLDDHTVTIVPIATSTATFAAPLNGAGTSSTQDAATEQKEVKKNSSAQFRLAQVDRGTNPQSTAVEAITTSHESAKKTQLDEVIVTAQKRDERLQDVPVPVTAISAQSLLDQNAVRLQDYFTQIPGLSLTPNALSASTLSIRGITTGGYANPTVGVVVDDVPYGSSTWIGGGLTLPDIDPGDLARVEVLRGPQGTLYGASSMGGLLKFVTVDPSTDGINGRVEAGTDTVYNGAQLGYNFRGSVNVPLSDTLAIRASGFTRQDPGYIDNPVLHIDGINEEHANGGRLALLWRPSDVLYVKLSALYQNTKSDGANDTDIQAGLQDLQQSYVRGVGGYDRTIQAYSATVTAKLGIAELSSITGYNINAFHDTWDFSYFFGPYTQAQFGVTGTPVASRNSTDKFTQEFRLSVPIGQKLDWLLGAFYTYENSTFSQTIYAANPTTGAVVGTWYYNPFPTTYREYAAFTDLTYHITDRFDVQVGGRESQITQTFNQVFVGPYDPVFLGSPSPVIYPETAAKSNAFTYLLTPRFAVSPDLMVYARLASGYRAGGINAVPPNVGLPLQYNPDKTQNYEIGVKGDVLDHSLSFNASVYYVAWKAIQLSLLDAQLGEGYNGNGAGAKSQGVELSIESKPLKGLTIAAWIALDDAELTEALPPASVAAGAYGVSGDRLPESSRFSGNLSMQQDFSLTKNLTGFVGGSLSYVGDRLGIFQASTTQRQYYPSYAKTDLRAGVIYNSWTTTLFVTNLTDKRGLLVGGLDYYPPQGFVYITPRTVGVSLAKTF